MDQSFISLNSHHPQLTSEETEKVMVLRRKGDEKSGLEAGALLRDQERRDTPVNMKSSPPYPSRVFYTRVLGFERRDTPSLYFGFAPSRPDNPTIAVLHLWKTAGLCLKRTRPPLL